MSYVRTSGNIVEQITFQHQPDKFLDQDNPASGTKYTVLDTTKNVRIISLCANCTWTVQPTPLQVYITIDGQTLIFEMVNPVSTTYYFVDIWASKAALGGNLVTTESEPNRAFLLEGRSVKIEVEITGGTVSEMLSRVKYAKIP